MSRTNLDGVDFNSRVSLAERTDLLTHNKSDLNLSCLPTVISHLTGQSENEISSLVANNWTRPVVERTRESVELLESLLDFFDFQEVGFFKPHSEFPSVQRMDFRSLFKSRSLLIEINENFYLAVVNGRVSPDPLFHALTEEHRVTRIWEVADTASHCLKPVIVDTTIRDRDAVTILRRERNDWLHRTTEGLLPYGLYTTHLEDSFYFKPDGELEIVVGASYLPNPEGASARPLRIGTEIGRCSSPMSALLSSDTTKPITELEPHYVTSRVMDTLRFLTALSVDYNIDHLETEYYKVSGVIQIKPATSQVLFNPPANSGRKTPIIFDRGYRGLLRALDRGRIDFQRPLRYPVRRAYLSGRRR